MNSCVHIYCGEGKGKTSAALGLCLRAAGRGKKILVVRFLKNDCSGEVKALAHLPGVCLIPCGQDFGFYFRMSEETKKEAGEYYCTLLGQALKRAKEEEFDMLVLDEIVAACNYGLAKEEVLLDFLSRRPKGLEVVLTGRSPSERLLAAADYVSEIRKVKHPFDEGRGAREGIEY